MENFLQIVGYLRKADFQSIPGSYSLCRTSIGIIASNGCEQTIYAMAWGSIAEMLSGIPKNTLIKIQGHIENKVYNMPCKFCRGVNKTYSYDILIDNFIIMEDL